MLSLKGSRVIVTPVYDSRKTAGGIIIPDVAVERCDQGIVKYIGPKVKDLKIGDYVLFSGFDGTAIRLEGEGDLILMHEINCKCVIGNIGTDIEGLYFKAKTSEKELQEFTIDLNSILNDDSFEGTTRVDTVNAIFRLFGKIESSRFFPATYEQAINLCAQAMGEKSISHKNRYMDRSDPTETIEIDEEELED